jgi:hypothetical protein
VIFFKGDGAQRGKIGVPPRRSLGIAGSYSGENKALTLVLYDHPENETRHVNSAWEKQEKPYGGDVIKFLQRWFSRARQAPARPVLRTGNIVTGRRACARCHHHPPPNHDPPGGRR